MKKHRSNQSTKESPNTFSHAWQNELNRCLFGNLLTPFEYGNEFGSELMFDEFNQTSNEVSAKDNKNKKL